MLFDLIGKEVAKLGAKSVLDGVLKSIHAYLADERAFNFAKEELRQRYEGPIQPASYEHVTNNLRLTKGDFLGYFKGKKTKQSLIQHLNSVLLVRSESWIYNRPDQVIFEEMIRDFLEAYQRYFETVDPHLSTLGLTETSREILTIVADIRTSLQASTALTGPDEGKPSSPLSPSLPTEFKAFLTVLNIPFEVREESDSRIDIIVIDPSSVFPSRFLLSARIGVISIDDIDDVLALSREISNVSNILLLYRTEPTRDVYAAAERRRVSLQSFDEFTTAFIKLAPRERFTLGAFAAKALAEGLNVADVYISPDAVPVVPGENMEDIFFQTRVSAGERVHKFLEDPHSGILFLLGSYGSGKSAFCAHLMNSLGTTSKYAPVYFALNQLESADGVLQVVTKADQLAKTTFPRAGMSVVILDGLDELPNAMNADEKKRNMLRILEAAARTEKLIITVRTSYFRGLADFWHLFRREDDNALWHDMARFITDRGRRPTASAMILREFDTDQIELYVQRFAEHANAEAGFVEDFLSQMGSDGVGFNYMMLARNPLYLFLLVNSRPWQSPAIRCLADIFEHFVRYWLERDIAKGRSRWNISTDDRIEFMKLFAWRLVQARRHAFSFAEFDKCVSDFVGSDIKSTDLRSIALDLQTTGVFSSVGDRIHFFTPGFLDYFIAMIWAHKEFERGEGSAALGQPKRLPTIDQARMWAGYSESHRVGTLYYGRKLLDQMGVRWSDSFLEKLKWDPRGIIYPHPPTDWRWAWLNKQGAAPLRGGELADVRYILNAVEQTVTDPGDAAFRILISNRRGLHARAAARWVTAYDKWLKDLPGREKPDVAIRREDHDRGVKLASIMGLMMLGASLHDVVFLEYENCSRGEVEALLLNMGCTIDPRTPGGWEDASEG